MTNEWYIIHYYHYKTVVGVFLTKLKAQKKKHDNFNFNIINYIIMKLSQ